MNRVTEISQLIKDYSQRLLALNSEIKWGYINDLLIKLEAYNNKIILEGKVDEEWWLVNCINEKSVQGEIFEYLMTIDDELFDYSIRLKNLNSKNNQITSSTTHFKPLIRNSLQKLASVGFSLLDEFEYQVQFMNKDEIIISLLYQRYDPPDVYIKRKIDVKWLRFGPMIEIALYGNHNLWDKYSGEDGKFFNYSLIDYHIALLNLIYPIITENVNFVEFINHKIDKIYRSIKTNS